MTKPSLTKRRPTTAGRIAALLAWSLLAPGIGTIGYLIYWAASERHRDYQDPDTGSGG